jgi:glycosyltransferase involved in cell wall biosynthesis
MPEITVLMPTYNRGRFIQRAVDSLMNQDLQNWELIIIDDGSTDNTGKEIAAFLIDPRVSYLRLQENRGMGASLNAGLSRSASPLIAYLPSDDVFYKEHLSSLVNLLNSRPEAVLAYSGVRHHYNRSAEGRIPGYPLQLVQIAHRVTGDKWLERPELITDNLDRMYWNQLRSHGEETGSGVVTCEWVDHPDQRHKLLREPVGGINLYRQRFNVKYPLRFHTSTGNFIDEVEHYRRFRERPDTPFASEGLKILLLGELAYNPERVLALEEAGHKLYGLWMREPYWYNTVGPLPFGHVQDLPYNNWRTAIREVQPDVIYALLNWQAVPFVHEVLNEVPDIPSVWHFKEGPFICMEKGTWPQLIDIYNNSDGHIYTSPEMRDWFETLLPGITRTHPNIVLDGDLPKQDWLVNIDRSPLISKGSGEFHTVVPGRPIGLHPADVVDLANNGIHLHFYGNFTQGQWLEWIEKTTRLAPKHIHLHPTVDQEDWVREFSQYDGGWLHYFKSENGGEIRRANWDDLNYPARIATLAVAGLPLLQRNNEGAVVATQSLVQSLNIGLFFSNMAELKEQLSDQEHMKQLRKNVWNQRHLFTFDAHVDDLIQFFRTVIVWKRSQPPYLNFDSGQSAAVLSSDEKKQNLSVDL